MTPGSRSEPPAGALAPGDSPAAAAGPRPVSSVRDLLAGCDEELAGALREALAADTGLRRVRVLHNSVRPSLVQHDAMVEVVLCPLLDRLPDGADLAAALRGGCAERADLLARFEAVSRHVAAPNVYPVAGEEVESILEGLDRSFAAHVGSETRGVSELLEAAGQSTDPQVLAAAMALEARRAPTRARPRATRRPGSSLSKSLYRWRDRVEDWSDTHWGWAERRASRSPREQLVDTLKRQAGTAPPSIRGLLEGYDEAVEAIAAEHRAARSAQTVLEEAAAAHRLATAVAIHDSVLASVLCPLLEAVPDGRAAGERLRTGCRERAELLLRWEALTKGVTADEAYRLHRDEANALVEALVAAFRRHEQEGTLEASSLLERLPDEAFRTRRSPLEDAMWPWHSEGPAALALHMALWAEGAPTRIHPLMERHPSSRLLRAVFHLVDHFSDHWGDSWLERWFFPERPQGPRAVAQQTASDAASREEVRTGGGRGAGTGRRRSPRERP